jgi:hypothetical protein
MVEGSIPCPATGARPEQMNPGTLDLGLGHCQPRKKLLSPGDRHESAASLWMELPDPPILANPRDHGPMDSGSSCAEGLDLVRAGLKGLRLHHRCGR